MRYPLLAIFSLIVLTSISVSSHAGIVVGTTERLFSVDSELLEAVEIASLAPDQIATNRDGGYWLLSGKTLYRLSSDGEVMLEKRLPPSMRRAGVQLLTEEDGLFIVSHKTLYQLDSSGVVKRELMLPSRAQDALIISDEIWVATKRQVLATSTHLASSEWSIKVQGNGTDYFGQMAINETMDRLWLTSHWQLKQFNAQGELMTSTPLTIAAIQDLVVDDKNNAWVSGLEQLVKISSNGSQVLSLWPLTSWFGGSNQGLVFDADSGLVGLADKNQMVLVNQQGGVEARKSVDELLPSVSNSPWSWLTGSREKVQVLAVTKAQPAVESLSLLEPSDGELLASAQPDVLVDVEGGDLETLQDQLELTSDSLSWRLNCQIDREQLACSVDGALDEGERTYRVVVRDDAGDLVAESDPVSWRVDTQAPTLTIAIPQDGSYKNENPLELIGEVSEPAVVMVNGNRVSPDLYGIFRHEVSLSEGVNQLITVATDLAGNVAHDSRVVFLDSTPPEAIEVSDISITYDGSEGVANYQVDVPSAEVGGVLVVTNVRTGEKEHYTINSTVVVGAMTASEDDDFSFYIVDTAGNRGAHSNIGADGGKAIDYSVPSLEVASLPSPGSTPFIHQVGFVFQGASPVQRGVDETAFDEERISVAKGRVIDRDGAALSGVLVQVKGHPEYGYTITRSDGQYDLAVNGGGVLTLEFSKAGYLSAQRQSDTDWNEVSHFPTVGLVQLDSNASVVQLDGRDGVQVAKGSLVSDEDGERQAVVLFPSGTQAKMKMPNGSYKDLETLSVRATEYTVGENGQQTMPGELPPTSGYTYAVELSVDEALSVGASKVTFDQPVPFYVDNFLEFPVGEAVPLGWYDYDRSAWVPADNGRVIKIIDEVAGKAVLDVDGSGEPATQALLDELDITEEELEKLAELYSVGASLWRSLITHFTPWDCNWPYGFEEGSEAPEGNSHGPQQDDDPDCSIGSIVECQNQVLGQKLEVEGIPYDLNYRSDRVTDRKAARTIDIPISGDSLPPNVVSMRVEVEIAGQRHSWDYDPATNASHHFEWNGKDAYGRDVSGQYIARVRVGFGYIPVFLRPGEFRRSFAQLGGAPASRGGYKGRTVIYAWRSEDVPLYTTTTPGQLGAWSLDVHHHYLANSRQLILGSGQSRVSNSITRKIETVATAGDVVNALRDIGEYIGTRHFYQDSLVSAPDGSLYWSGNRTANQRVLKITPEGEIEKYAGKETRGYSGDGGAATEAELNLPRGMAVSSGGTLFIADWGNHRIRKVAPNGIITTVAGNGEEAYSGDGLSAEQAGLYQPTAVAISSDNSLYIAHRLPEPPYGSVIRKVDPSGLISTVAGAAPAVTSTCDENSGDVDDPQRARFANISAMQIDESGNLIIVDTQCHVVRKLDRSGTVSTIAGSMQWPRYGDSGDGDLAVNSELHGPHGLAISNDSGLLLTSNNRIRKIDGQGYIRTIAGLANVSGSGDGGLALDARFNGVSGVTQLGNGSVYVAEHAEGLRKIDFQFPGVQGDSYIVPSEEGRLLYQFSKMGFHLQTVDAVTGETLYEFQYDADNRLTQITDVDGNITVIERNGSGQPMAIVGPEGQRVELALDQNGYLSSIKESSNHEWQVSYTQGGLLTAFTYPNNNQSFYEYDAMGRLLRTTNEEEGGWQLSRQYDASQKGYEASIESREGRVRVYTVGEESGSSTLYRTTYPNLTQKIRRVIGSTTELTQTNGMVVTSQTAPDPRFGRSAKYTASRVLETPSGLIYNEQRNKSATLADDNDLLSHTKLTETRTVNGRTSQALFTRADNNWRFESPEGRVRNTQVDGAGRPVNVQVAGFHTLHYQYDNKGRLAAMSSKNAAGTALRDAQFTYNTLGKVSLFSDALQRETHYEYDVAGRVTRMTLPGQREVLYDYDANGNLTRLTPPGKTAHVFHYNGVDQETGYIPPSPSTGEGDTYATHYQYNLDQQLTQMTRPDGQQVQLQYGATTGNLDSVQTPRGTYSYTYDPNIGQLSSVTSPDSVTVQTVYDGFLVTAQHWSGPISGSVSWQYNNDFLPTQSQVNSGQTITYGYDNDNLLTQAGDLSINRSATNGLITGTTLADITTSRQYNGFGEIDAVGASHAGEGELYQASYIRDKLGRITQKTEKLPSPTSGEAGEEPGERVETTTVYGYDTAGRLQTVTRNGATITYSYDANGNRLSKADPSGTVTGQYDEQDRLTQYGNNSYEYNANGDLMAKNTQAGTIEYDYDVFGNLISATIPSPLAGEAQGEGAVEIDYLIDGQNRRVAKLVNGTQVQGFLYKDQLNPIAELDGSGNVVSRFVYADKANIPSYMIKGGQTYRIISDHLGSPRMVVNTADGAIAQQMSYDEFGQVVEDSNPGFQPFGFAGGIYDQHTKLTRFGARDYDAETGRWTTKDPIRFEGGLNLFGYVANDPVNWVDIWGLEGEQATVELVNPRGADWSEARENNPHLPGPQYPGDYATEYTDKAERDVCVTCPNGEKYYTPIPGDHLPDIMDKFNNGWKKEHPDPTEEYCE
ncbi:NHL repeat containing protein [gamma proteobacterium HTCC5015]|nr:NHL repeat containing protein [gamma proteobacterium HTCC5015]